jgi:hypothetical protein
VKLVNAGLAKHSLPHAIKRMMAALAAVVPYCIVQRHSHLPANCSPTAWHLKICSCGDGKAARPMPKLSFSAPSTSEDQHTVLLTHNPFTLWLQPQPAPTALWCHPARPTAWCADSATPPSTHTHKHTASGSASDNGHQVGTKWQSDRLAELSQTPLRLRPLPSPELTQQRQPTPPRRPRLHSRRRRHPMSRSPPPTRPTTPPPARAPPGLS